MIWAVCTVPCSLSWAMSAAPPVVVVVAAMISEGGVMMTVTVLSFFACLSVSIKSSYLDSCMERWLGASPPVVSLAPWRELRMCPLVAKTMALSYGWAPSCLRLNASRLIQILAKYTFVFSHP